MSFGYFSLPRSLTENPLWIDLPPAYQCIFIKILELCCYQPRKFDDHGKMIDLKAGQLCISERELKEKCGKWIDRNQVQRAIAKFKMYEFVSQEVSHTKSILTITHLDTYNLISGVGEPASEPKLSQSRAKVEPQTNNGNKDNKVKKEQPAVDPLAASLLDEFNSSLLFHLPQYNAHKISKDQKQINAMSALLSIHGPEKVRKTFQYAHKSEFWISHVHTCVYLKNKFETLSTQMQTGEKNASIKKSSYDAGSNDPAKPRFQGKVLTFC